MSSYTKNDNEPELDPYNVLGVPPTASDADINKAFKKLALKLHPDKQQQQEQQQEGKNNKSINREQAEEAFHQVQWAKSFLLDAEFAEQRRKYDAKRASIQVRRVADEARTVGMSDKRRRMRDELQRQEQQASSWLKQRNESAAAAAAAPTHGSNRRQEEEGSKAAAKRDSNRGHKKSPKKSSSTTTAEENANLERLRRQGNEMREAYADRQEQTAAAAAKSRTSRREREQYDYVQQDDEDEQQRQVRLKWSRKKMASSSSSSSGSSVLTESYLMHLLKQRGFGEIERVEMLGNKGNAALVTFVSADSCRPCVDALIDSEEMRATFVGKRKEQEELDEAVAEKRKREQQEPLSSSGNRDAESVADWKLRRAAEREELLRQVERDEDTTATKTQANNNTSSSISSKGQKRKATTVFPPLLPKNNMADHQTDLSPFELLQRAEVDILEKNGILSRQEMRVFQAKVL